MVKTDLITLLQTYNCIEYVICDYSSEIFIIGVFRDNLRIAVKQRTLEDAVAMIDKLLKEVYVF